MWKATRRSVNFLWCCTPDTRRYVSQILGDACQKSGKITARSCHIMSMCSPRWRLVCTWAIPPLEWLRKCATGEGRWSQWTFSCSQEVWLVLTKHEGHRDATMIYFGDLTKNVTNVDLVLPVFLFFNKPERVEALTCCEPQIVFVMVVNNFNSRPHSADSANSCCYNSKVTKSHYLRSQQPIKLSVLNWKLVFLPNAVQDPGFSQKKSVFQENHWNIIFQCFEALWWVMNANPKGPKGGHWEKWVDTSVNSCIDLWKPKHGEHPKQAT